MRLKPTLFPLIIGLILLSCEYRPSPDYPDFNFNFEKDSELNLINWKCHTLFRLSDSVALNGHNSLKVSFFPSDEEAYPGFSMGSFKRNWQHKDTLVLNVFNPAQDSVRLILRIDDSDNPTYADRYNHGFMLANGWTAVRLPLNTISTSGTNRVLRSRAIKSLILFFANLDRKRTLYFDQLFIARFIGNE